MQIPFVTVDVFTDRKFGGNQLAVIPDGRDLTSAQMQAIAREFNIAETTFVLPPQDRAHTAQVRIFTPRAELPFAGHPNIGTAYVLAMEANKAGRALAEPLVFEEKAGLVRLDLIKDGNSTSGARLAPPQALHRGEDLDAEIIAAACSLPASDIETANSSSLRRLLRQSTCLRGIKNARGAGGGAAAHRSLHQAPARPANHWRPALCA